MQSVRPDGEAVPLRGLTAQGGALGVGRAVRRAVIHSIVLILIISYDFTWLVYRAFMS